MSNRLFPHGVSVSHGEFEIELAEEGVRAFPGLLDRLREDIIRIASRSRGWEGPDQLDFFRRHFKIEPLYETDALALVRKRGRLEGLAGAVNDWRVKEGSIVHLCALGFLPELQARGFLQALFGLLWTITLRKPEVRRDYLANRLFATAITQSPYIFCFMRRFAETFPSPDREAPRAEEVGIAQQVVARFDPHLELERRRFVLRDECLFRYRRIPYSCDRRLNLFCDRTLRYDRGDVLVIVGRVIPQRLERYLASVRARLPGLVESLRRLEPPGAALPRRSLGGGRS